MGRRTSVCFVCCFALIAALACMVIWEDDIFKKGDSALTSEFLVVNPKKILQLEEEHSILIYSRDEAAKITSFDLDCEDNSLPTSASWKKGSSKAVLSGKTSGEEIYFLVQNLTVAFRHGGEAHCRLILNRTPPGFRLDLSVKRGKFSFRDSPFRLMSPNQLHLTVSDRFRNTDSFQKIDFTVRFTAQNGGESITFVEDKIVEYGNGTYGIFYDLPHSDTAWEVDINIILLFVRNTAMMPVPEWLKTGPPYFFDLEKAVEHSAKSSQESDFPHCLSRTRREHVKIIAPLKKKLRSCKPEHMAHANGYWPVIPMADDQRQYTWILNDCEWKPWMQRPPEFFKFRCLEPHKISKILMIGNSVTRGHFASLAEYYNLRESVDQSGATTFHVGDQATTAGGLDLFWRWLPTLSDAYSSERLNQYYGDIHADEEFKKLEMGLRNVFRGYASDTGELDVVIINTGISDSGYSEPYFRKRAELLVEIVESEFASAKLIWRSNTPLHPPRCWNYFLSAKKMSTEDQIMRETVSKRSRWSFVDLWHIGYASHAFCNDGLHYTHRVYQSMLNLMFNALCT
eukprot:TRINITY_DN8311_c0_g1_i2.p1 TRINITY_DN8311_c0_g1~~TRINITY_DN8311_c0_g1_i2.p1  ORF type:complete len:570 (+),score=45.57 TRINITY_DN8311_c0_g1_i2:28-1737(+)